MLGTFIMAIKILRLVDQGINLETTLGIISLVLVMATVLESRIFKTLDKIARMFNVLFAREIT